MSKKAKAIQTLYNINKISIDGVKKAVKSNIITEEEYFIITGFSYPTTK